MKYQREREKKQEKDTVVSSYIQGMDGIKEEREQAHRFVKTAIVGALYVVLLGSMVTGISGGNVMIQALRHAIGPSYPIHMRVDEQTVDVTQSQYSQQVTDLWERFIRTTDATNGRKTISETYVFAGSNQMELAQEELDGLSYGQLHLALYEIYARHGRRFFDENLQAYFDSKSWYVPLPEDVLYSEGDLNDIERSNIVAIKETMERYEETHTVDPHNWTEMNVDEIRKHLKSEDASEFALDQAEDGLIRALYMNLTELGL